MLSELAGLPGPDVYHLLTQVIVPRPIAWVVSENRPDATDRWNIAPYSYFNGVASSPPLVMFSVGIGLAGRTKDTLRNVSERPRHTIALPTQGQLDAVQTTARPLPPGESEFDTAGLAAVAWEGAVPRPSGCRVALDCIVEQIIDVVPDEQIMVISRVDRLWVDDSAVAADARGRTIISAEALDPLARLGAGRYSGVGPSRYPSDGATWRPDERT